MQARLGAIVAVVALLFASSADAAERRILVWPLYSQQTEGKLTIAEQAALDDMIRGSATSILGPEGWTIVTVDTLKALGQMPAKCDFGTCQPLAARRLSAEQTVSGTVQFDHDRLVATIGVVETTTGRDLITSSAEGADAATLMAALKGKVSELFVRSSLIRPLPEPPPMVAGPPGTVAIPGGTFLLGVANNATLAAMTRVSLSPYRMDRTEVTVAQYKACVDGGECTPAWSVIAGPNVSDQDKKQFNRFCNWGVAGKEDHPINCVTWKQAKRYCEAQGGRLPTEAEWEFAARGTDARKYPWGNTEPNVKEALFGSTRGTSPASSHVEGASAFGVLNMAGNVQEWVADSYRDYPGGSVVNPRSDYGDGRGIRGGSWYDGAGSLDAATRGSLDETARDSLTGFRCARDMN